MTDKELLELAAKAAGYLDDEWMRLRYEKKTWNPLTDDGDALRLAVKLNMSIDMVLMAIYAARKCVAAIALGTDSYAATRLAIVKAAAEIGRTLP